MIKRKIFFWSVFKDLASPFALGLFIFTFILLMGNILKLMDLLINKGIGLFSVLQLLVFMLPSFLVLTIPMSVLLAILIVLGRLSADSEIIAMKASGISLYQMLPPFAALSLLGFFFTGFMTLSLLPNGNQAFRDCIYNLARTSSAAGLEEGVFNDSLPGLVLYVDRFNPGEKLIEGVLVSDSRDPQMSVVIAAEKGYIISAADSPKLLLQLVNGSLHMLDSAMNTYHYSLFTTYEMAIPLGGGEQEARTVKYKEMQLDGLLQLVRQRNAANESSIRIRVEIHRRLAFPFACLVFALLGLPLGISWRKGGRSYGFVLSILIVFLYYLLLNIGESLVKSGNLPVFVGIWLPNALLAGLGVYLFQKVAREDAIPFQALTAGALELVTKAAAVLSKRKTLSGGHEATAPGRDGETPFGPGAQPTPDTGRVVFRGNPETAVFHRPGCRYYKIKHCTESFQTAEEAERAGYRPCNRCRPGQ